MKHYPNTGSVVYSAAMTCNTDLHVYFFWTASELLEQCTLSHSRFPWGRWQPTCDPTVKLFYTSSALFDAAVTSFRFTMSQQQQNTKQSITTHTNNNYITFCLFFDIKHFDLLVFVLELCWHKFIAKWYRKLLGTGKLIKLSVTHEGRRSLNYSNALLRNLLNLSIPKALLA